MPEVTLGQDGLEVMYKTFAMTLHTLMYGVACVMVPFAVHILLKSGARTGRNALLLVMILTPFAISSLYWGVSFAEQIIRLKMYFVNRANRDKILDTTLVGYATLFNAIGLLNYIFGDIVIVWRLFSLCRIDYGNWLYVSLVFLTLNLVSGFAIIGIRIVTFTIQEGSRTMERLDLALDVFQMSTLAWSLLTNVSATSIIAHKAWKHRQTIQAGLRNMRSKTTQAERVLALLMESGIVYFLSSVILIVLMVLRLPRGTLGDIYSPVNQVVAGMYPSIVIVLVSLQQSMNETVFNMSELPQIARTDISIVLSPGPQTEFRVVLSQPGDGDELGPAASPKEEV